MLVAGNLGPLLAADRTRAGPRTSPLPDRVGHGVMGLLVLPLTIGEEAKVTVHWGGGKRGRERVGRTGGNASWRIHRFRSRGWRATAGVPKNRNLQLKSKAREFVTITWKLGNGLGDWGLLCGTVIPLLSSPALHVSETIEKIISSSCPPPLQLRTWTNPLASAEQFLSMIQTVLPSPLFRVKTDLTLSPDSCSPGLFPA